MCYSKLCAPPFSIGSDSAVTKRFPVKLEPKTNSTCWEKFSINSFMAFSSSEKSKWEFLFYNGIWVTFWHCRNSVFFNLLASYNILSFWCQNLFIVIPKGVTSFKILFYFNRFNHFWSYFPKVLAFQFSSCLSSVRLFLMLLFLVHGTWDLGINFFYF